MIVLIDSNQEMTEEKRENRYNQDDTRRTKRASKNGKCLPERIA
jgi:hypothetical protein